MWSMKDRFWSMRTPRYLARACNEPSETLAHIVQYCPRTHEERLGRHNNVVKRLAGGLSDKGMTAVTLERIFKLQGGDLKPDIVGLIPDGPRGPVSVICDVQVCSGRDTEAWHMNKVRKYADRADLKTMIRAEHLSTEVRTVVATLNWRGVWSPQSLRSLKALGLSSRFLAGLSTRVLRGTLFSWYGFNRKTGTYRRVGVG